eukprot:jgi/Mesen1/9499/ME000063S08947
MRVTGLHGSLHVPLFVEDTDDSALTLLKKQIQFGFGGWWLGQRLTRPNDDFVPQVVQVAPKRSTRLLVACGEGLRSLVAVDELHQAGYTELAWLVGGFNMSREGDFADVVGETKLHFATAGGVQGLLLKLGQSVADATGRGAPTQKKTPVVAPSSEEPAPAPSAED